MQKHISREDIGHKSRSVSNPVLCRFVSIPITYIKARWLEFVLITLICGMAFVLDGVPAELKFAVLVVTMTNLVNNIILVTNAKKLKFSLKKD